MTYKQKIKVALRTIVAVLLVKMAGQIHAAPYATDVTNNAGVVSFRLNENADNVKIISGGGAVTNDLGAKNKGLTVTNLGIANGVIKVVVLRSAAAGYVQSSADASLENGVYVNKFEQPRGLVVNRNPATPSFGRIYVANGRGQATTATLVRTNFQGIYMLNSDDTVALDTGTTPRTAGLAFTANNTATPNRLSIGKDDNQLYICDWSDPSGGLWTTDPDVTTGINVLEGIGGVATHGSIPAAWVEGVAGNNLKVFTSDEDLTPFNSLWRYDVANAALPYAGAGTLLGSPTVTSTSQVMDLVRGGVNNYLYLTQRRSTGTEANVFVFTEDGTFITNSLLASRAFTGVSTNVDLLREVLAVDISPDGSTLALLRAISPGVLFVPLTNGVFNLSGTNGVSAVAGSANNKDISYDAAGNLYVINSGSEWLRIFSRGGATLATTGTDGTFVMGTPPLLVGASATVATANEQGPVNGQFTITRSGDVAGALTVTYTVSGTATAGSDYTALPGSVTFLPGATSTNISVAVLGDSIPEFTETVVLTMNANPNYGLSSVAATVSILDNEGADISFVPVATKQLLEGYATSKVTYQVARRGLLTSSLTVNLAYSGTAVRAADFNGPLSVSLAANAVNANVTLTSLNDQNYEGNETATITVASGTGYAVGTTNSIDATVVDDETPLGSTLFEDPFETNSLPRWVVNAADPSDGTVDFAWDYGANAGIPPAPGSATTLGMRFQCGNTFLTRNGISVSPFEGNFTGDYRVKFNMWINYNGPLPDGGAGSTQHFDTGVGTTGNHTVWLDAAESDGVWFSTTCDGAGFDARGDYNAYIATTLQDDDSGVYAAGVGTPNSGVRDGANPYYAYWGGVTAPSFQTNLYHGPAPAPSQLGTANIGNAGMAWHSVVVTKVSNTVNWSIDGISIATVTNDPGAMSTNVFVGYQDVFATGSLSDNPSMSFGLVDNFRVETFSSAPPTTPNITGIQVVGSTVVINFTGGSADSPSSFTVQSSGDVGAAFQNDLTANISGSGGTFQATIPMNGAARFYKIKR